MNIIQKFKAWKYLLWVFLKMIKSINFIYFGLAGFLVSEKEKLKHKNLFVRTLTFPSTAEL